MKRIQDQITPISDHFKNLKLITDQLKPPGEFFDATKFIREFQNYYQPIKVDTTKFNIDNSVITYFAEISQRLNASIQNLSLYKYDLDDYQEEEVKEEKEEKIIKVVDTTKLLIKDIYENNQLLTTIDPRKFEEVIAELLHAKGFEVNLTKQTRDGGYDILALQKIAGLPIKFLVECKRYNKRKVGVDIIRSFCDVIRTEQANKGIIFTTSYFSKDSHKKQTELGTMLDLKDRGDIFEWIFDYNKNFH